jgi:DNA-binding beta-propeller fold protein YncE
MTDHRRIQMLAAGAIDFGLPPTERSELDTHLDECPDCRRSVSRLRDQAILLRDRPRAIAPAALRQRFEADMGSDRIRLRSGDAFRLGLVATTAILATIALAALGFGSDRHRSSVVESPTPVSTAPEPPASSIPSIGGVGSLAVPAGPLAHEHLCNVMVASDCAADVIFAADSVWTTTSDGVARIDPATDAIVATITAGAFPHRLVVAAGSLWVTVADPTTLVRIDLATNKIVARIPIGSPMALAAADGGVWVAGATAGSIVFVDARTNTSTTSIAVGDAPSGIVVFEGELWATSGARRLVRVDTSTSLKSTSVDLPGTDEVKVVVAALGRIWFAGHDSVTMYDPATGKVGRHAVPNYPTITFDGRDLWVASGWNSTIQRIDPNSFAVLGQQTLPIDQSQWAAPVAVGAGSIWIRSYERDELLRLDPSP